MTFDEVHLCRRLSGVRAVRSFIADSKCLLWIFTMRYVVFFLYFTWVDDLAEYNVQVSKLSKEKELFPCFPNYLRKFSVV